MMRAAVGVAVWSLWLAGCASAPAVSVVSSASIPIEVLKPPGDGPFPAIVVLHDCSGLGPRSGGAPRRWARELVRQGYVVALPDSFSTRGHRDGVCLASEPNRAEVAPPRRVPDAYEALEHLRSLAYVDGAHVGVIGGSHGGTTALVSVAITARDTAQSAERKRQGFAAAVALYPGCGTRDGVFTLQAVAPLLVLSGELDDWTPAPYCVRMAEAATGAPVRVKVYPGAHHAFDSDRPVRYVSNRANSNAPGGHGATTGGDAQAWADSIREVTAFFEQHLGKR
jgi:dienelactone hydrolase